MEVAERPEARNGVIGRNHIAVQNPITGAEIGKIPVLTDDDVRAAAAAAAEAQPAWEELGVKARGRLLGAWADLMWEHQDKVIRTIREETGKTRFGAWEEAVVIDSTVSYYAHRAPQFLRPRRRPTSVPGKQTGRVYYKPHGICGFITPWNYPLLNALQDLIPALIAGNTVLLKPSEITPYTVLYAVDLMHQAGIPRDVIQVVTGDGRTGAALVEVADYIAFTGSTATGRKIAMRCAERLIPCSLELGGKDPMIILKDADLDLAATGALIGAFDNCGQICISTERVYVEDAVYDAFIERAKHYAGQLNIGSGDGFLDLHMGSLTNERELLRTEAHIADAVAKGARVVHGGGRRPDLGPLFFEPTILADVDHSMEVMREETFGPVMPVMRVKDADEAIALANDSEYGLSASIYSKDLKRAEALAIRLESGDAHINCSQWVFGVPSLPMGGVKASGMGRRNGPEGLLRFVRPQSILIDNQLLDRPKLTQLDSFGVRVALALRRIRRAIPFLRL